MLTKAEKTTQYILEKVAPFFNKHGYTGTSMSDITKATGLTKGAIYGNFENKEELALKAFNYNIRKMLDPLISKLRGGLSGLEKLKAITNFYRTYFDKVITYGGCPVLNVGIDSVHHNSILYKRTIEVINKLNRAIEDDINQAKKEGTIKKSIDARKYANKIYSQIQGSCFLAMMLKDINKMIEMMDHIDHMIETEMMN